MPRGNGTGPAGMGPMTGRAAGFCAGYEIPGCANLGGGHGFGGGRGWRHRFWATGLTGRQRLAAGYPDLEWDGMPPASGPRVSPALSDEQKIKLLKDQEEYFKTALADIHQRIQEYEGPSSKE